MPDENHNIVHYLKAEAEARAIRDNEVVSVGRWVSKIMSELRKPSEGNGATTGVALALIEGAAAMACRRADGSLDEDEARQILADTIVMVGKWRLGVPAPVPAPMTLGEFLARVVDDGIAVTRKSYQDNRDAAIAGFESCRGVRTRQEFAERLIEVEMKLNDEYARADRTGDRSSYHWHLAFRTAVQWVAACISAVLENQELPVIVPPTGRSFDMAASILGVAGSVSI